MRDLNIFESVFKRALREKFEFSEPRINKILLVTDLTEEELIDYADKVRAFLNPVLPMAAKNMISLGSKDFNKWRELSDHLDRENPDLIISYRLLRVADEEIRYSLGVFIDTLTQILPHPVLILPNPHLSQTELRLDQYGGVMVATEHLYHDHSLVNYAAKFTQRDACLTLVHIEDLETFEYYMKAIEKIPEIDNEVAREKLTEQLKADPGHYMDSVIEVLAQVKPKIKVAKENDFGHMVTVYGNLIRERPVDLLVFHSKDDTQLAMHSLGYSLAVEFRDIPVLLI